MTLKWGFSELQQQLLAPSKPADIARMYSMVKDLKPQYWRMMVAWNLVAVAKDPATTNGRDWSTVDNCINDILLLGCQVILIIGQGRPGWAGTGLPADYGNFCAEVATRYKPGGPGIRTDGIYASNTGKGVTLFEVWNEENQATFWGGSPTPATYTEYLKSAYTKIKAVSGLSGSSSKIIFGGFQHVWRNAFANFWRWAGIPEITFLEECYSYEPALGSYYDVMATHIYTQSDNTAYGGSVVGPAPDPATDNLMQLRDIHDLMVTKGDGAKPVWITEAGFWTYTLSESLQSTYMQDLFTYLNGLGYVEVVLIYNIRDVDSNSTAVENTCGVMKTDFTKKAIWTWLTSYAPTTGTGGASMSTSGVSLGMTTTADLFVRIRAQLRMGQRLDATTSLGVATTAGIVNPGGHMVGASNTGITTTASMVVNGVTGSTTVGMTATSDFSVLTLVGATSIGIQT